MEWISMTIATLCDQYTKEQLAEKAVKLETEMAGIELMEAEGASFAETIVRDNAAFKTENAELREMLKEIETHTHISADMDGEAKDALLLIRHIASKVINDQKATVGTS